MVSPGNRSTSKEKFSFLSGGGEMGALIREKDWSKTPVGNPETWPQSLRTALSIILHSKFPMFLFWGPDLVCFYNDAYRPSLGNNGKHPYLLGERAEEHWQEIWHIIKPLIDQVLGGGEATWSEDQLIPIYRNGKIEDVYWTFSYSAVNDESEKPAGVFITCSETTDKINAFKILSENNDRYFNDILQSPIAMCFLRGEDFVVEIINKFMLELLGKDAGEIMNKPLFEGMAEASGQGFEELLYNVYNTGQKYVANERAVNLPRNGKIETIFVDFTYQPLRKPDGTISGIVATATDVTLQITARKKLEESKQRFQAAVGAVEGIIWTNNADGQMEGEQPGWAALTGQSFDEYQGYGWSKAIHPEDAQPTIDAWNDAVLHKKHFVFEHRVKLKNNTWGMFSVKAIPVLNSDGAIVEWVGVHTDITEQKHAEKELVGALLQLEKSEEKFRTLAENMSQFAWMADDKGWIYWYNKQWYDYTGTTFEEMQGWGWQKVHHPDHVERVVKKIQHSFDTGEYWEDTFPLKSKTGEYNWFLSRASAIRGADGKISHWFGTNTNITDQKNIEENLAYRTALLEAYQHASFDGILLVDGKGKIISHNNRFTEAWDMPKEIIEANDDVAALDFAKNQSVSPEKFMDRVNYLYNHPEETSIDELELKNGKILERFGYPVKGSDGTFYAWAWIFRDITEKKNYENSLLESEQRFKNVANSAPVFIWMAGTDKLRYFFNTAWLKFTGRTLEQEKGNGWAAGIHPDDFKNYLNKYHTAFEKKEEFYTEYRLKRYDGEYRWVSAKGVPRFTSEETFDGFTGACMDIHERVIYQKKLKEDEERLNIIINASELGTWELNVKTKEIIYSDRYLEILGYKNRIELNHHELIKHLHPDDFGIRERAFKKALSTGILQYEARLIWNDKSIHWMEGKGKVFYDENNQPEKLIGTTRDITEEKNYQQQLLAREQKFRLLADSMPEFVWTGDTEGNLNYFNQSVYDYTGLTAEEINKEGWLQIVHPDDRDENIRLWLHAITTGKDFLFEHRFKRYDGEYRWQLSRATPQKDAAGNIQMWVGTSTDIQDMKEMDAQKDLFISMASHELKTPVTSIKGYVQILQSMHANSEDDFLKKSLSIIDKQIVNLTDLIADMLDLSKIKTGSLSLNKENFKINELVVEIAEEIRHINPNATVIFSHEDEAVVFADRSRIGQVLINFLSNAVKYSPGTGTIKIKSAVEKDVVIISVEDSGIGISKTDQKKIFERFYRVEGKNEKTFPGFGIGLFIASEIIRNHGGDIGVVSEPGKGSIFSFSLPCTNNLNKINVS
ncbi:PAS domain S-box protein [Ferruginibacter sp.]